MLGLWYANLARYLDMAGQDLLVDLSDLFDLYDISDLSDQCDPARRVEGSHSHQSSIFRMQHRPFDDMKPGYGPKRDIFRARG